MPELLRLSTYLRRRLEQREPLVAIVEFFNVVSPWHDRTLGDIVAAFEPVNHGQHDEVITTLRALEQHFIRAGRNSHMNRTRHGQRVTADEVFLGGVHELGEHPVSFWMSRKTEKPGLHPGFANGNAYDIVCDQARRFMDSHIPRMVRLIGELEILAR